MKVSLMTVITFAASIIGPFVSFLDIDVICYIASIDFSPAAAIL